MRGPVIRPALAELGADQLRDLALDVDELRAHGTWFKHARPGRGPLPYRNPAPDNRWQRGAFVDAIYLGDSPDTVWAEWYRHLAEAGIPPAERLRWSYGSGP